MRGLRRDRRARQDVRHAGGPAEIVRDFTLHVGEGEFVCLLGHSGCGKSTVLSIVMGLIPPTHRRRRHRRPRGRRPRHGPRRGLPVGDAAAVAVGARERRARARPGAPGSAADAERYLAAVGLGGHGRPAIRASCRPGMQQRVGIARAFALEPRLLLLDEPFSLLDALTRMELQDELMTLWERTRKTVLMVTHDVDEALLLADRIVHDDERPRRDDRPRSSTSRFPRPRRREEILARARLLLAARLDPELPRGARRTPGLRRAHACGGWRPHALPVLRRRLRPARARSRMVPSPA